MSDRHAAAHHSYSFSRSNLTLSGEAVASLCSISSSHVAPCTIARHNQSTTPVVAASKMDPHVDGGCLLMTENNVVVKLVQSKRASKRGTR